MSRSHSHSVSDVERTEHLSAKCPRYAIADKSSDGQRPKFVAALIAFYLMVEKFRFGPKHSNVGTGAEGQADADGRTDGRTDGRMSGRKKWGAAGMHSAAGDG